MMEQLYSHVLVPTDFRPDCKAAYRIAFAAALGSGATVSLLHVLPAADEDEYQGLDAVRLLHRAAEQLGGASWLADDERDVHDQCRNRLRAEVHPEWAGPVKLRMEVRRGDVVTEIAQYAQETSVDLIVTVGSRSGNFLKIGRSLSGRLARATPVKVVRVTPPVRAV